MAYQNGRLPKSALTEVEPGNFLAIKTARAWKAAKAAAFKELGRSLAIADPAGAYRSYATQADMRVHPSRYNMNPHSGALLAQPGYSQHGWGTCVDVIGSVIDVRLITLMRRFGFTRPLTNDPNHFLHDGVTATGVLPVVPKPSVKKTVKVTAGQTLSKIAANAGITLTHLLTLNPSITNADKISVGQVIRIK